MDDRWAKRLARIDLDRVRERLDAALVPVEGLDVEGEVFLARAEDPIFLEDAILGDLSEEDREAAFDELWYDGVVEAALGPDALESEVSCEVYSSMTSGSWGLSSCVIGPRGYFVETPDPDTREEGMYRLLGGWEPARSRPTYEAAWVETYVAWWSEIGLPPFRGEVAHGPEELMLRALARILGDDDAHWAREVEYVLRDSPEARGHAVRAAAEDTGLPEATVAEVLRALAAGEPVPDVPEDVRRHIVRRAYLALW